MGKKREVPAFVEIWGSWDNGEMYFDRERYASFVKQLALTGVLHKCPISRGCLIMPDDLVIRNVYESFLNTKSTKRRS